MSAVLADNSEFFGLANQFLKATCACTMLAVGHHARLARLCKPNFTDAACGFFRIHFVAFRFDLL